ncbi:MAG: GtrA family protein [Paludibacteraceae bacterium]|nr:GtrA family protein [Paludibacteraceae bacterium]
MKLPSSYLPEKIRSAVRFAVVGTAGMFVQTGIFMLMLWALGQPQKGGGAYYVAFALGYAFEVIPNYLFLNWYTFGTKPDLKNAGGFVLARIINLGVQLGLLPLVLCWLPTWRDDLISYVVIFIGGCINYLICLLFFKKKKDENIQS